MHGKPEYTNRPAAAPGKGVSISLRASGAVLCGVFFLAGCVPELVTDILEPRDLTPASVAAWDSPAVRELAVEFDEDVRADAGAFAVVPDLGTLDIQAEGRRIRIRTTQDMEPGQSVMLEGLVEDAAGNTTSFVLPFWGFNPRLPRVVINEALTQGSASHPDALELRALEAGSLAGLALHVGTRTSSAARYIFPACEVAPGEFIVLHLKPQGIPEEIDEIEDPAASGGLDASEGARDFWYTGGDAALPGENGMVTLYRSAAGGLLDALLYSVRTSESDTKYAGFGTRTLLDQVLDLEAEGGWIFSDEGARPEDAARSAGVASTRTLCRSSDSRDTDSGADWHVVPTRGSTLGAANSDEVYVP